MIAPSDKLLDVTGSENVDGCMLHDLDQARPLVPAVHHIQQGLASAGALFGY